MKNKLRAPWEDGLILTVFGLRVGFLVLRERLLRLWKLKGNFELLDLGEGFYLAKFDCVEDREAVINGGPWMIFDHYLAVSQWSSEFSPVNCKIRKALVWVRLPALGLMYYEESALRVIASTIGKPVKIDVNTLEINRAKYARICVEIDLELPVVSSVLIDGKWQRLEYKGLHLICTHCGCYGHFKNECRGKGMLDSGGLREENLVPGHSVVEAGGKVMDGLGTDDAAIMHSVETGSLPPQPPIGDWVVVSSCRKKNGKPKAKAVNLTESREGALQRERHKPSQTQGASQKSSPMPTMGGRNKSAAAGSKPLQRQGNGLGNRATGQLVGAGFSSLKQLSLPNDDMPGLKRPRSSEAMGNGNLVNPGSELEMPGGGLQGGDSVVVPMQEATVIENT